MVGGALALDDGTRLVTGRVAQAWGRDGGDGGDGGL